MLKLIDCVDIAENNQACVILKVLPEKAKDLIRIGYFNGNETMFRLTKGDTQTCTVFYNDGSSFSWHWGLGGYTLVNDATSKVGKMIEACIIADFDIAINGTKEQMQNDLRIQSKKDAEHGVHEIKVMSVDESCIHKDGAYYKVRPQSGLQNVIDHFASLGYSVTSDIVETVAPNGCPIKTFTIER